MNVQEKAKLPDERKRKLIFTVIIVAVVMAVTVVFIWQYVKSDVFICRKYIMQAEESMRKGDYMEALSSCNKALEIDEAFADAYLQAADIYMAMNTCGDAIDLLRDGMIKVNDNDMQKMEDTLEKVCRKQADNLVGTWIWEYDYDLVNFLPDSISEMLGWEISVEIYLEFRKDSTLWMHADKDNFSKGVDSIVNETVLRFAGEVIAEKAGKAAGLVMGLLGQDISVDFTYETEGDVIYLYPPEEGIREAYVFRADEKTLLFMEAVDMEENSLNFDLPLELNRVDTKR